MSGPVLFHNVSSYISANCVMQTTHPHAAHSGPLSKVPDNHFLLQSIVFTPVKVKVLEYFLRTHPDRCLVNFVISGFTYGFELGFFGEILKSSARNNKSALEHEDLVDEAILKELNRGHTLGPFTTPPLPNFHILPLGAALKKDGTARVVLDLSSPKNYSVNDGISKIDYSVSYSSFDEAVNIVRKLGRGCFMMKLDIKHAFRLCPVHYEDWHLLGYKWHERHFFDIVLAFGGRSSPFIFNSVADVLHWIVSVLFSIPNLLHYLDDFFSAQLTQDICKRVLEFIVNLFSFIGVPLAPDKIVEPTNVIVYLGIKIDTIDLTIRLPEEKLGELKSSLEIWIKRKKCTKRELLSLIGSLSFACKVVKSGRIFLRRLIDLSTTVSSLEHRITLNAEARKDILWWKEFLPYWNGVEIIQEEVVDSDSIRFFTDASGIGIGVFYDGSWFSLPIQNTKNLGIAYFELLAVLVATMTWGASWCNKQILILTDNQSICDIWFTGSCKDSDIMSLVRKLFFFTAKHNINLLMRHVPGKDNILADPLSRLQVERFASLCKDIVTRQALVPEEALLLLKET